MKRTFRVLAAVTAGTLVLGAFGGVPATAKKKKLKCPAFVPVAPEDGSQADEALEAKVVKITKKHTEDKPLVIEYEHGPALWAYYGIGAEPIQEDAVWFNFQIYNKAALNGVYMRMEWPGAESDMDMYWYDASGAEIYNSGAFNQAAVDATVIDFTDGGAGGSGFESASGFPLAKCAQLTVESRGFLTPGEPMTLKVWYGEIQEQDE